jgi:hypothetical protein
MNELKSGLFVTKLVVIGPAKPDAELTFVDGLNVVSGASDTGKSFAFSCIDFAFGSSSPPRSIPEASGYDTVRLHFTVRETLQSFIIERPFRGRRVRIIREIDEYEAEEITMPAQHNGADPATLSGFLLKSVSLWGLQVRKNVRGQRRSVSFRDIAHLCLIDEERIIAERPPHLSGQYTTGTVEGEILRILITGNESGSEAVAIPKSGRILGIDAKMEIVDRMVSGEESELQALGIDRGQIAVELEEIESARKKATETYEHTRINIVDLEGDLQRSDLELRKVQARAGVVEGLISRFGLLTAHYESNIARLGLISETGSLLTALPSEHCPLCGADPQSHRIEDGDLGGDPERVRAAALRESQKFEVLRDDLNRIITELKQERVELEVRRGQSSEDLRILQRIIGDELEPTMKASAEALAAQNQRRDVLLKGIMVLDNISKLHHVGSELQRLRDATKSELPVIGETASSTEMDAFAVTVGEVLLAWNYPDPGDVFFSEEEQDLIIGAHGRASHGKGVRALTCAAFIVGAMKHCQKIGLPHPSLVVLDSPLVAYKEPDSADHKALEQAGVKEEFYNSFANGLVAGQVIVFENEDPPDDLGAGVATHRFTKSSIGRYGFFPRNP